MGMMIVRHKIRDYGQWRPSFDAHAEMQRAAGLANHVSIIPPIVTRPKLLSSSTPRIRRRRRSRGVRRPQRSNDGGLSRHPNTHFLESID
jgi:hypothetical protein